MPKILTINTGLDNERDLEYLKQLTGHSSSNCNGSSSGSSSSCSSSTGITENTSPTNIRPTSNGFAKQCRYGSNCSRLDCHFAHPERNKPQSQQQHQQLPTNTTDSNAVPNEHNKNESDKLLSSWFPLSFKMKIHDDGNIEITNERLIDAAWSTKSRCDVTTKLEFLDLEREKKVVEDEEEEEEKVGEETQNGIFCLYLKFFIRANFLSLLCFQTQIPNIIH